MYMTHQQQPMCQPVWLFLCFRHFQLPPQGTAKGKATSKNSALIASRFHDDLTMIIWDLLGAIFENPDMVVDFARGNRNLVGGFSPTHLKHYAQVKWVIISPGFRVKIKKVWVATDKGMIVSPRVPKWEPALQRLKTVGENMEILMFYRGCGRVLLGDFFVWKDQQKITTTHRFWRKTTIWKTFWAWNAWKGSNMFVGRTILHSWSAWPANSWGYGFVIHLKGSHIIWSKPKQLSIQW